MADVRSVEFVVINSNKLILKNYNHLVESVFRQQHFAKRVLFYPYLIGAVIWQWGLIWSFAVAKIFMLFLFNEENSKETQYSKKDQTLSINFYFWVKKFKIKLPLSWSLITIIAIIFCASTCWWDPSAIGKNHPLKLISKTLD